MASLTIKYSLWDDMRYMKDRDMYFGYEHWFELYIMQDKFDTSDWGKTILAFAQYIGFLKKFKIVVTIADSTVKYYVGTNKDVGFLSNNLEGVVLRPVEFESIKVPVGSGNEGFIHYVDGGNLLDLREKYQVKRSKELGCAVFSIRAINANSAVTSAELFFKSLTGEYSVSHKTLFLYPSHLLAVDFLVNTKYLRAKQPKYLDIQKTLHIMRSDPMDAVFEVNTFPYLPNNYYLPLQSYDFDLL